MCASLKKKIFSDPAYQAMYEAFVEEGLEHSEAVKRVREFIEELKKPKKPFSVPSVWKIPPYSRGHKTDWNERHKDTVEELNKIRDEMKKMTKKWNESYESKV